jgi:carbon-monoxide dehydrogenase medium subunit
VKPAPFELHRPVSSLEAVEILGAFGDDAKVLAGGQSLVPLLALRLVTPAHLVDLDLVEGLRRVEVADGTVTIGAMVSHQAVGRDAAVERWAPLLARAVPLVGHAAIRNRGTIGGSLAHADPAAEYPAVCLALGARMELLGPNGTRQVPADEFFVSTFTTSLEADELLCAVHLPATEGASGCAVEEIAQRHGDFALAGAACSVRLDTQGRVERAGIALFGVADRPWRAAEAEAALLGTSASAVDSAALADVAVTGLEPGDSLHASGRYLRHAARVLVGRCVRRAMAEASNG